MPCALCLFSTELKPWCLIQWSIHYKLYWCRTQDAHHAGVNSHPATATVSGWRQTSAWEDRCWSRQMQKCKDAVLTIKWLPMRTIILPGSWITYANSRNVSWHLVIVLFVLKCTLMKYLWSDVKRQYIMLRSILRARVHLPSKWKWW